MSVDYCHKHHNYYDTDFETDCLQCVDEEVEQSEQKENDQVFFIHNVVSSAIDCNHNSQRDKHFKNNYLKWFEFADNEIANGREQTRCTKCYKWLFPSEV